MSPNLPNRVPNVLLFLLLLIAVLQLLPQVLKKDSQHVAARGMWDVLRRGTSQALFSDLTEVVKWPLRCFFPFDYCSATVTTQQAPLRNLTLLYA